MAKEKTMNYTPEQTAELVAAYTGAADLDAKASVISEFAEAFGKSVASVRQKLVREGVYEKKEYVTKSGNKPESKDAIANEIAKLLDVNAEVAESLAKANKKILELVRDALAEKG